LGCSKSSSKREVYSNTGLTQEARKISNKQHNLALKGARKITTTKETETNRRKEIIKTRAEINDMQTKNNNR